MKKPNELFKEAHKRAMERSPEIKFKSGDVIINTKFGIVSIVIEVWNNEYELHDIKNSRKNPRNFKYHRYQLCEIIDTFYELVNPTMARLLYGVG